MSSSSKLSSKTKTSSKTKSDNKLVINDKSPAHVWKQYANDLKNQNEQLQIQNDQLQRNVKDLESKCEAILKTVLGQPAAGDCPASTSFAGLINQPLAEVLVKLSDLQKKQSDVGTLSSRVEELETRLTSNYDEIAKLLQIKMKVESCLEQILMYRDLSEVKDIARKTLDECSEVYLFISSPEMKMVNSTSLKTEKLKTQNNYVQDTEHLPHLTKPSQKFPGDTHISKIEPNLKKHIFYELNKETRKDVIMADTSIEILAILRHYFKLGLKAAEAAPRIQEVEGNEIISDRTAQNWFKHFKGGDLSLEIKPRSGQPAVVDYDALKCKVEENPTTSTRKLSEELGSLKDTICRALYKL